MKKLFYFLMSVLCLTACGDDPLEDPATDPVPDTIPVYQFKVTADYHSENGSTYMNVMDFHVDYASGHVDAAHDSVVKQAIVYGGYLPNSDSTEFSMSYCTYYIHPKGDTLYYYEDAISDSIDVILLFDEFKGNDQSIKGMTYKLDCYGGSKYNPYTITLDYDRIWPEYDDAIHEVLTKRGWILDREGQNSYYLDTHEHLGVEVYQIGDFNIEVNFYYR